MMKRGEHRGRLSLSSLFGVSSGSCRDALSVPKTPTTLPRVLQSHETQSVSTLLGRSTPKWRGRVGCRTDVGWEFSPTPRTSFAFWWGAETGVCVVRVGLGGGRAHWGRGQWRVSSDNAYERPPPNDPDGSVFGLSSRALPFGVVDHYIRVRLKEEGPRGHVSPEPPPTRRPFHLVDLFTNESRRHRRPGLDTTTATTRSPTGCRRALLCLGGPRPPKVPKTPRVHGVEPGGTHYSGRFGTY